jgi:hypothetical protein
MRLRIFPIALIVLGVTLLLGNLGIVPKDEIRHFVHTWWPLLLVVFGSAMLLFQKGNCRQRICQPRPDESSAKAGPG